MSAIPEPEQYPVEVSRFGENDRHRYVRIMQPGKRPVWMMCANQAEFEAAVELYRPGTDFNDPGQVYWVDHPEIWIGTGRKQ